MTIYTARVLISESNYQIHFDEAMIVYKTLEKFFPVQMSDLSESHLISHALDDGLDLRQFANELAEKLSDAEGKTVRMFLDNSAEAVDLHLRVKKCDDILEKVEMMLEGFQGKGF